MGIALIALAMLAIHVSADVDRYEVYAVRFATLANFPVSSLAAGADRSRRTDAMMIWVLKGIDGRIAIVDSGFHRERYFTQFTVKDSVEDVTDILLSHMHWDHASASTAFRRRASGCRRTSTTTTPATPGSPPAPTAASTRTMCWKS